MVKTNNNLIGSEPLGATPLEEEDLSELLPRHITTRRELFDAEFKNITAWIVGGHSLGGVAACGYAGDAADKIEGVVLLASYPSETFRIDDKNLSVLSIYGTEDGLTTLDKIETSQQHLPERTRFVEIRGGNHTQFGWYGINDELQKGDNAASITRDEQHNQILKATVSFLNRL